MYFRWPPHSVGVVVLLVSLVLAQQAFPRDRSAPNRWSYPTRRTGRFRYGITRHAVAEVVGVDDTTFNAGLGCHK
jgi:hypothetical protein